MANLKANECGFHCDRDKECTHFSYTNGTCYFHSGSISRSDAKKSSDPNDEGFCGLAMVKGIIILIDLIDLTFYMNLYNVCDF